MNTTDISNLISLAPTDQGIIVVYFVLVTFIGLYFSRRASKGIANYFLGGKRIPWWVLGASGTASNIDMAGTMVVVSFFYAIGLQGIWVAMRGGIGLPLGIVMAFMGRWLQRSDVLTTAEWMTLRFGPGRGGNAARILSAASNLVVTVGFVVYFCKGTGKFLSLYLPFSPDTCAIVMMAMGLLYTAAAGLYGVVYTDLVQEVLMITTAVVVSYLAFSLPDLSALVASAGPEWIQLTPRWQADPMPWLADPTVYQMFGLTIFAWVSRGLLEGAGGFTGSYIPQRYYASRSEREAALLSAEWIILLVLRWTMIIGFALLGLKLSGQFPALATFLASDPEMTLPVVLGKALPTGFKGVAVAGLIAAAMSTFDSTINAGASYWVRDIYQRYISPEAEEKQLMRQSYAATLVIAVSSLLIALTIHNINEIWQWITGPLSAGLFAPIVLRWYWWRFNGEGFAIATGMGLLTAVFMKLFGSDLPLYVTFPLTSLISLVGGIVGSLLTRPSPEEAVKAFYAQVFPFGFWGPIRRALGQTHPSVVKADRENRLLLVNTPLAVVWHLSLFLVAIFFVLRRWQSVTTFLLVAAAASFVLFFTWYRTLPPNPVEADVAQPQP